MRVLRIPNPVLDLEHPGIEYRVHNRVTETVVQCSIDELFLWLNSENIELLRAMLDEAEAKLEIPLGANEVKCGSH